MTKRATNKLSPTGMLIRALRQQSKTGLREMADYMGIAACDLSAIEFGRRALTQIQADQIAAFVFKIPRAEHDRQQQRRRQAAAAFWQAVGRLTAETPARRPAHTEQTAVSNGGAALGCRSRYGKEK